MNDHPSQIWMWGHKEAIGTELYWRIEHKVLRGGQWISDVPYSCGTEVFARQEAAKMAQQTGYTGRNLYKEVSVSGPYVSWREIWWKERESPAT